MRQNIDQNINLPQENSLQKKPSPSNVAKFNLKNKPKIIFFITLISFIIILLISLVFLSKNKKESPSPTNNSPEPEKNINTPTPISQFNQMINQIETDINSSSLLEPPQIDDEIGL